ncbi:hypothetical protein STXM2123_2527 [Streptomyces sp. F-3]|nr:hypothetical protein STXM2123_2527 [Streptomyces sp. F-3]
MPPRATTARPLHPRRRARPLRCARLHDRVPGDEWHFRMTTTHAPGEEMRRLALEMRAFLESEPLE